jgi:hypothetical protein
LRSGRNFEEGRCLFDDEIAARRQDDFEIDDQGQLAGKIKLPSIGAAVKIPQIRRK